MKKAMPVLRGAKKYYTRVMLANNRGILTILYQGCTFEKSLLKGVYVYKGC